MEVAHERLCSSLDMQITLHLYFALIGWNDAVSRPWELSNADRDDNAV
jgi:hypothetical protein